VILLNDFRIEMERDVGCIFSWPRHTKRIDGRIFLLSPLSLSNSGLAKA
jgi:hypothetical protein